MVKLEWDRQKIVVHGEDNQCVSGDSIVPYIESEDNKGPWVYQVFDKVSVEKIPEGEVVTTPTIAAASVMVDLEMFKNGFMPGKGLGACLKGIVQSVSLPKNLDTFDLRFKPTAADIRRVSKLKQRAWALPKPIPRLSRSFVKPSTNKCLVPKFPCMLIDADGDLDKGLERLFNEVNMVETGEELSRGDVQFVGARGKVNNWEATLLPPEGSRSS